ncbi:MAG: DUF1257 domain-containing protein [Kiritimatiellia bacterium]|jgi:hypothetical protein|nr:DUF1257 domain-containing protein [Kiritimatiellia bacterium]
MSHFTSIQTQVRDILALREACRELGLTVEEKAEARGYGDNKRKGEFVIRLKGPYDIALNEQQDGSYGLTTDWWQGHVAKEVGEKYGTLLQLYGVYKAQAEAKRKGYTTRRQNLKDGAIKLTIGGVR